MAHTNNISFFFFRVFGRVRQQDDGVDTGDLSPNDAWFWWSRVEAYLIRMDRNTKAVQVW